MAEIVLTREQAVKMFVKLGKELPEDCAAAEPMECPDCEQPMHLENTVHSFQYGHVNPVPLSATYPMWVCKCGCRVSDWRGEEAQDQAVRNYLGSKK